jgi:acyl-CoA hydrolase
LSGGCRDTACGDGDVILLSTASPQEEAVTDPEATTPSGGRAADERHRLSMTILMTPDMSNFAGNVHGGILLKYLDQVAYTCATRYARTYAVTLSVDQVVFREPIHVGELVTFDASVNRTGRTSMEVGVRVTTQDLVSQTVRHTNSSYFTMVAIGPDGRPVPVPSWEPRTAEERRRHLAAERRQQLRRDIDRARAEIRQAAHAEDDAS